ncbi:sigma-70 family RNA polymerase sigma factor [Pelagicoccus mobilis]|uniref:Sigma-70 family RNA polymerase sigma factor n=1 Tax=Pelagicoccus mobilis TaxID=415221 RepID=A0A934S3J2_9BACT|nr:sigma-70 family RNA polymerase sigma factor [Pelagicoccus mobilis]MBK1879132.1 sigma-70 family RNA polymerase sigma factor [Pelagicoccus mobilis]
MSLPDPDFDESFVTEITESQSLLRAYILKLVGCRQAMKDILQDSNVVIWRKRMDWDPQTPFLKWAYRIAYFQTKAWLRDHQRQRLRFSSKTLELLANEEPNPERHEDVFDALELCLSKLNASNREILLKRYQGTHTVEELAIQHERSPNGFSQLLRRLRTKLAQCIEIQLNQAAQS